MCENRKIVVALVKVSTEYIPAANIFLFTVSLFSS